MAGSVVFLLVAFVTTFSVHALMMPVTHDTIDHMRIQGHSEAEIAKAIALSQASPSFFARSDFRTPRRDNPMDAYYSMHRKETVKLVPYQASAWKRYRGSRRMVRKMLDRDSFLQWVNAQSPQFLRRFQRLEGSAWVSPVNTAGHQDTEGREDSRYLEEVAPQRALRPHWAL